MESFKQEIEENSVDIQQMIASVLNGRTRELDDYIDSIKTRLAQPNSISTQELDRIIVDIPVFLYYVIEGLEELNVKKGVSGEKAKFYENELIINSTGTVSEKQAKACNATVKNRLVQLVYKTAASILQNKINTALELLNSAKKVQQRRLEEMKLTKIAGNSISF